MTGDDADLGTEVVAVLLALAGVRTGDAVAQRGAGGRVERGLLAMAGVPAPVLAQARVAVAGGPDHLRDVVEALAEGGRLVALAPDQATARTAAEALGVTGLHVVDLDVGVAWSGRLTGTSRPPH